MNNRKTIKSLFTLSALTIASFGISALYADDESSSVVGSALSESSSFSIPWVEPSLQPINPYVEHSYNKSSAFTSTELLEPYIVDFSKEKDDGEWKLSFDLNQPTLSDGDMFAFDSQQASNVSIESALSLDGIDNQSKFYVNFGAKRVPVSVSFEDPSMASSLGVPSESDSYRLGLNHSFVGDSPNQGWDVSIEYTKSAFEINNDSVNSLLGTNSQNNLQYLYDFNQDGTPEAINLVNNLGLLNNSSQDIEGIKIKISRQVGSELVIGSAINNSEANYWLNTTNMSQNVSNNYEEKTVSVFGDYNLDSEWSLAANLEHKKNHYVSILTNAETELENQSTTLDIGLKYQTQWNDAGLIIRIDLMNLLGNSLLNSQFGGNSLNSDSDGLAPYIFETPKYIKVSGSINF